MLCGLNFGDGFGWGWVGVGDILVWFWWVFWVWCMMFVVCCGTLFVYVMGVRFRCSDFCILRDVEFWFVGCCGCVRFWVGGWLLVCFLFVVFLDRLVLLFFDFVVVSWLRWLMLLGCLMGLLVVWIGLWFRFVFVEWG